MALRLEYERKCEELKAHYEKKMKVVREEYDEKRKEEVARIELKKNTHIADLMAKHKKVSKEERKREGRMGVWIMLHFTLVSSIIDMQLVARIFFQRVLMSV